MTLVRLHIYIYIDNKIFCLSGIYKFYIIIQESASNTQATEAILKEESVVVGVEKMSLIEADKATIILDEADLEYDEDFASLVVEQNNLG